MNLRNIVTELVISALGSLLAALVLHLLAW